MSEIKFRKLRDGEWGLFGPRECLLAAQRAHLPVDVTKADGSVAEALVERVSKGFHVAGAEMAYAHVTKSGLRHRRSHSSRDDGCPRCGSDEYDGGLCDLCHYVGT